MRRSVKLFSLLVVSCVCLHSLRASDSSKLMYYLNISDFSQSFIEIPTSNVAVNSSTISSSYLAGRAAVYNMNNQQVGTCSASFLCMQNANGIFADISNHLSINNGLVVSWPTPATLVNLELNTIIGAMVTKCSVMVSTATGTSPLFGQKYSLVVSSDGAKLYFLFAKTP
jgi:hypothetical protein